MRLLLQETLLRDVRASDGESRAALFEVLLRLPQVLGDPHAHGGIGIRKVHPRGIWEARLGLGLRLVFGVEEDLLVVSRVGNHDEIRRYLRSL